MEPENQELETSLADDVAMATNEEVRESAEGKSLCSPQLATKIHTVILENVIRHLHRILVEKVSLFNPHVANGHAHHNFLRDSTFIFRLLQMFFNFYLIFL